MKITINITGQVENTNDLRKDIDAILEKYFKSFKFNWELLRGLEK